MKNLQRKFSKFFLKFFPIISILLLTPLNSCLGARFIGKKNNSVIRGVIYDGFNQPAKDMEIILELIDDDTSKKRSRPKSKALTSFSNANGKFVFQRLKKRRKYTLAVHHRQYENLEMELVTTDNFNVVYLSIFTARQLLEFARNAINQDSFLEAKDYLQRVEKMSRTERVETLYTFLRSIYYYHIEDYTNANKYIDDLNAKYNNITAFKDLKIKIDRELVN